MNRLWSTYRGGPVAALCATVAITLALSACRSSGSEARATPSSTRQAVQTVGHPNVWVLGTLPRSTDYLRQVACATETQCVAVGITDDNRAGVIVYSSDGGKHWASATVPTAVADVQDVSCGDQVTCVATGRTATESLFLTTRDGGVHWDAAPAPPNTTPTILSCIGSSCLALAIVHEGDGLLSSKDGGYSWTPLPVPSGGDSGRGVACFSFGQCWFSTSKAERASLFVTDDFGKTWTNRTPSDSSSADLNQVFCYDEAHCWAAGEGILSTSDGGDHWTRQRLPAGVDPVESVSCATASACWLLGDNVVSRRREVLSTSDAGLVWTEDILPPLPAKPSALVCPGASRCVAVGQGLAVSLAP